MGLLKIQRNVYEDFVICQSPTKKLACDIIHPPPPPQFVKCIGILVMGY